MRRDYQTKPKPLEQIITTFAPLQRPVRDYATQKNVLDSLRKALLRQLTVVLRGYQKPGAGHSKDYLVDPYSLVLYQYGLYLVGYSHRAREIRTFAVERIKSVEVTEDMFELPQSFSLAERFSRVRPDRGATAGSEDLDLSRLGVFRQRTKLASNPDPSSPEGWLCDPDHAVRRLRRAHRLGSFLRARGSGARPASVDRQCVQPTDVSSQAVSILPLAIFNDQRLFCRTLVFGSLHAHMREGNHERIHVSLEKHQ